MIKSEIVAHVARVAENGNLLPPATQVWANCTQELARFAGEKAGKISGLLLRRGHANLLCIVPILIYVPPK